MAYAPFDGVLLDDPRDPIPGVVAIALHHRVERALALRDRRPELKGQALRDRAAACQALLNQGLLPAQLRALGQDGLSLGSPREPRSLASLVRHLEAYLEAVDAQGFLEPGAALWRAADARRSGGRGFWVERHPEDGPLHAGVRDLAPPSLRALCTLTELGTVCFRLSTRRGTGRGRLFADREPHLVRQLLPALESLGELEHLELETPEGWGENPWGAALDGLFEGPLGLDERASAALRRAVLPTEAAVWRGAVEQICAWVAGGLAPSDITLMHPDPAGVGPLLAPLLAAEGIPLRNRPGAALAGAPIWGSLRCLLQGVRDLDPATLGAGLASPARTPLGRACRALAAKLSLVDQTGEQALHQALDALGEGDRAWLQDRWNFLWSLRGKSQPPAAWLADLEALASRLELARGEASFHAVLGLLEEAWWSEKSTLPFPEFLAEFEDALEILREPDAPPEARGVQLLAPAALESGWEGARATLLLDLGEGAWPSAPAPLPELDWMRMMDLNRALRAQSAAGGGAPDFPPHLQAFILPQAEEGEILPRAFHRDAYRLNRVLALTRDELVALSAARDADGQPRSQGPFWHALEGAGPWAPDAERAASRLRWRWEAAEPEGLVRLRQEGLRTGASVEPDRLPGVWTRGEAPDLPLAPTLLEGLARCPFRVHAAKHLQLSAWDEDDAHILHVGTLAHRLMETMLAGLEEEAHWPAAFLDRQGLAAPATAPLLEAFRRCWAAHAHAWFASLEPTSRLERERLHLALEELLPAMAGLLAEDLQQGEPLKEELEALGLPPGLPWRRELAGLEVELEPRRLDLPGTEPVWVHGTVDRLERWISGDTRFLRIVDYKTSRYEALKDYRADDGPVGPHLQLPLYQILLEQERGDPATALLVSLRETWKPLSMTLTGNARATLLTNIAALLGLARRGDFPPRPGQHCSACALGALCARPADLDPVAEDEA